MIFGVFMYMGSSDIKDLRSETFEQQYEAVKYQNL